jgi:low affinity Fe/Cu permease
MPDFQTDKSIQSWFTRFATGTARASGHPVAFGLACASLVVWGITGPFLEFGDTWQLTINTVTTIITFLMVFVIQNTQNRDTEAMQIKLDELIRTAHGAHLVLLDLEELDSKELDKFRARYEKLASEARRDLDRGRPDTDTRPV